MKTFTRASMMRNPFARRPESRTAWSWRHGLSFLGGLLVGSTAGAAVMWLMAPRAGKRTRAKLSHQVEEMREQVMEGMENAEEDVLEQAHRVAADVRGRAKSWRRRGETMMPHK